MPIAYKQYFTGFQHQLDDVHAEQRILFFDPQMERSAVPVGDRFRALDAALRDVDLIVVRSAEPSLASTLLSDTVIQAAIHTTPIALLCGSVNRRELSPTIELLPGCRTQHALPDLSSLRQAELLSIFTRTRSVFSGPEHHFAMPSGYHADKFVRLGDALRDAVELQRIVDWVMPYVEETSTILGDTGSILSLITEVVNRAFRLFGWQLPYDCLSEYPVDRREVQQRFADLRRRGREGTTSVFVVSVNSSGQTLELVGNTMQGNVQRVTVCDTHGGDTPGIVLSSLSVRRWESDADGRCPECMNSPAMLIDPQTYERLPSFGWNLRPLRHDTVQTERDFWQMADSCGAVELHVSKPYKQDTIARQRHFGVFIDTIKLAECEAFRRRCAERLSQFRPPDIVLIPDHDSAVAVEIVLRDVVPDVRTIRVRPGPLEADIAAQLCTATCIWVVDDAVVTGTTMRGFRTFVYQAVRDQRPLPEVFAFALIARASTDEEMRAVSRPYRGAEGSHFSSGARVYLPQPGVETCPWCLEKALLTDCLNDLSGASRETALLRINQLDVPLEPPFLLGAGQKSVAELVTAGSFFGDLHQKTAFAACVSATLSLLGTFRTPHTSDIIDVFDLAMIVSAYFEAVFPSAVMRTAVRSQLWCPKSEPALTSTLRNIDLSRVLPGTIPELGVAAALGKVPPQAIIDLLDRAITHNSDPVLRMLQDVIRLNIRGQGIPAASSQSQIPFTDTDVGDGPFE